MMSILIAAFFMGGIGSLHCVGMCGPLALSLPVVSNTHTSRFGSTLLYNLGRMLTYALLGAIFGIVGMSFALFGYQQWLSIVIGVLIIIFIVVPKQNYSKSNPVLRFFEWLRKPLGDLFSRKNYRSVFFIGILNGLLPCGLLYMAIAGAISTASVMKSSLFMAAFGLGTLPMMWSVAFFGSYINLQVRQGIKKLYPYLMFVMAVILILRGLALDIPFVSPAIQEHQQGKEATIKCHD